MGFCTQVVSAALSFWKSHHELNLDVEAKI